MTRPGTATGTTVGAHLLRRLKELGCDHIFGIPGDFILPFFDQILASELELVSPCNEFNGGYAADAYARIRGIGAVAVTYGPGGMSLVNAAAGAYSENVPLVLISGGPETRDYRSPRLLHHVIAGKMDATIEVFRPLTACAEVILDPATAPDRIDAALAQCVAHKLPIYLELPRDVQTARTAAPAGPLSPLRLESDAGMLKKAVEHAAGLIRNSRNGVILPGHLVQRERLEPETIKLLHATQFVAASMVTGKADYLEHVPQSIGTYQGSGSPPAVRERVEGADVVLTLGLVESDFNLGGFTAQLRDERMIRAGRDEVRIQDVRYRGVRLGDFMHALLEALPRSDRPPAVTEKHFGHSARETYTPRPETPITSKRLFDRLAHFFRSGDIVTADASGLIETIFTEFPEGARLIGQSYWASIGYGFAAGLGAAFAGTTGARVICVEGDGSFQMTAQELSTMVRYGKDVVVVVLNNKGYVTERVIHDGPYNNIHDWKYHRLAEAFGGEAGAEVFTEGDLETALARAGASRRPGPFVINVHLEPMDASEALKRMSDEMRARTA